MVMGEGTCALSGDELRDAFLTLRGRTSSKAALALCGCTDDAIAEATPSVGSDWRVELGVRAVDALQRLESNDHVAAHGAAVKPIMPNYVTR